MYTCDDTWCIVGDDPSVEAHLGRVAPELIRVARLLPHYDLTAAHALSAAYVEAEVGALRVELFILLSGCGQFLPPLVV